MWCSFSIMPNRVDTSIHKSGCLRFRKCQAGINRLIILLNRLFPDSEKTTAPATGCRDAQNRAHPRITVVGGNSIERSKCTTATCCSGNVRDHIVMCEGVAVAVGEAVATGAAYGTRTPASDYQHTGDGDVSG